MLVSWGEKNVHDWQYKTEGICQAGGNSQIQEYVLQKYISTQ